MRSNLLKSILSNVFGQSLVMIANLVITPVFITHLGADGYGLWAIILAFSGTVSGLDLGMSVGLIRAIPELLRKEEYDHLSGMIGAVIIFYLVLSGLAALFVVSLGRFIVPLLNAKTTSGVDISKLLTYSVLIFAFSGLSGVARAILQGLNRFDLLASMQVVTFVIYAVMSLVFLYHGWGLIGLVVAMVMMFILQLIGGFLMISRLCPFIRLERRYILSRLVWSYLLNFGMRIQISYMADIIKTQAPKLLAALFLGPATAGFYELGNRIANAGWSIPVALLPALVPSASTAAAAGDLPRLQNLYVKGTRYLVIVIVPMGVALALFSNEIFIVWLGVGYQNAAFVLLCLALGNILHLSTGVGTFIGRGMARPGIEVRYQLLTLFLYLLLCYSFFQLLGFDGIPLGVAFASGIGAIYFLVSFSRTINVRLSIFFFAVFSKPLAALLPALTLTGLGYYIIGSRLTPLYQILILGSIFGLVYMSIVGILLIKTDRNLPITVLSTIRDMLGSRRG